MESMCLDYLSLKRSKCVHCIRLKASGGKSAELVNITSSLPMESMCLDYLSLKRSKGGHKNVLVITYHARAIPNAESNG